MSADCIPAKTRETLIRAMFDCVEMGRLMCQPGVKEEDADLIYGFVKEAESELLDWSSNV